ncbi:MAG TPA: G/U mismatch-specific DNA glycosylase [Pseudonocardia sp.]|nr:G/U mismatch-specific DNA glycosylase [Pseudonocardia sp.]
MLFCGINPGLLSAARGQHFARPGNRFWPALHRSGFTETQLPPADQHRLAVSGLGITNLVARPSARAQELGREELRAGGERLVELAEATGATWVAILGVTAYRTAFDRPKALIGRQPTMLGSSRLWVLPNPSGLNAHWTLPALTEEFARLRAAATSTTTTRTPPQ